MSFLLKLCHIKNFFLIFFFLLIFQKSFCFENKLSFFELSNLHSIDNYGCFQDSNGIIWIYSENGLTRYSFSSPKTFTIKDGLISNDIWDIKEDKKGRLWLFFKGKGACYIFNGKVYQVNKARDINELYYVGERNDTVFFRQFFSLSQINFSNRFYLAKNGTFGKLNSNYPIVFFSNPKLNIYKSKLGFTFGLNSNLTSSSISTHTAAFIKDEYHFYFNNYRDWNTIFFVNKTKWKKSNFIKWIGDDFIWFKILGPDQLLIKTKNKGYLSFTSVSKNQRDRNLEQFLNSNFSDAKSAFHCLVDRENNLWITFKRNKIYFIPYYLRSIKFYPVKSQLIDENFSDIFLLSNEVYLMNRESFFLKLNQRKELNSIIKSNDVKDIKSKKGHFYFSNSDGIFKVDNLSDGNIKKIFSGYVFSFDFISDSIILTNNGLLVNIYDFSSTKISWPYSNCKKILFLNGNVFLQSLNKTVFFSLNTRKVIRVFKNPVKKIKKLNEYLFAIIYESGSVEIINSQGITHSKYNFTNIVKDLILKDNLLIIATTKGLYFYSKSNSSYHKESFLDLSFNNRNIQVQCIEVKGNELFVCTNEGMISLKTNYVKNKQNINFFIDYIFSNSDYTLNKRKIVLKHSFKGVDFHSVCGWYSSYNNLSYCLHIKNESIDTILKYKFSTINLPRFDYGNYSLRLYAEDECNSSNSINYSLIIEPPIYLRGWFITLSVITFSFIFYISFIYFLKNKTKKLNKKNQLLELEISSLKSQLNPHFLFNSLNKLQALIFTKNELFVNDYITSLSRLMRGLLDNSKMTSVTISEEIQFLSSYVKLQSFKDDNQINLIFNIDSKIDQNNLKIRNMLLQPYVENAIIHGFDNFKGYKEISIKMEMLDDKYIKISIKDNGIGISKSLLNKLNTRKNHKSWGNEILNNKKELLNQLYNQDISIEMIDLSKSGKIGTLVVINMKIVK